MNIYKIRRTYKNDTRTTWHDRKLSADNIVRRHKRLGSILMRRLDKLAKKYPIEKRVEDHLLAEEYEMESAKICERFAEEHGEPDAPLKWVEVTKFTIEPTRSGFVSFVRSIQGVHHHEWHEGGHRS
jgi:hypothetical protein